MGGSNHSVLKVDRTFYPHISWLVLTGSDRKPLACDQRFHVGRRHKSEQKLPRDVRGKSSVYAVKMLSLLLHKIGMQAIAKQPRPSDGRSELLLILMRLGIADGQDLLRFFPSGTLQPPVRQAMPHNSVQYSVQSLAYRLWLVQAFCCFRRRIYPAAGTLPVCARSHG